MKRLGIILCIITATGCLSASGKGTATTSLFATPPTIDGTIEAGEWHGAVRTTGFMEIGKHWLEAGMGSAYVGFSKERLFIAIVTELPPDGKLVANRKLRDGRLVFDDSFELWLNPYRNGKAGGTYFQILGNYIGTVGDTKFTGKGAPDKGWDPKMSFANGIHRTVEEGPAWARENGVWTAELSIPFAELGWDGDPIGRSIGILICRNFKRAAGWKQPTWFPHKGSFVSWFEYPEIKLTANAPSIQIQSLGEGALDGSIDLKLDIHNPGPARKANLDLNIESSSMPSLEDERAIDLPASGTATYTYTVADERLHANAKHKLNLAVTSADGAETWFKTFMRIRQQGEFWTGVHMGPNPKAAVRLAYYPSYQFIRLRINPGALGPEHAERKKATVTVHNEAGKELLSESMAWDGKVGDRRFKVGDLPDGAYTATVAIDDYDQQVFKRTFRRIHYAWEKNRLGITKKVLPPFEPMKVEGNDVSVVMRTVRQDGLGLWSSVKAAGNESPARELLAGPIRLLAGGQELEGTGEFTEQANHRVIYEGNAKHPAVQIDTRCITEYDGCMKVIMTLKPGAKADAELESLHLDIPMKDALASLWHCSTTALRRNPVGATPAGDGRVWDSRDFPDGEWYGNFHPYLWVGGEERGICWFADNDKGWVLKKDDDGFAPCQELIRKDGVLTVRINLVQKPVTIDEPRTIVFGLMASPGKPMPKDWRRVTFNNRYKNYPRIIWMGSTYWGTREVMAETYPIHRDMSILDKMQEARLTGDRNVAKPFMPVWSQRHLTGDWPTHGRKLQDKATSRKLAEHSIKRAHNAGPNDYLNVYWEEFHNVSRNHPETQIFGNEWSGGFGVGGMHPLTDSYLDFQCWYGAQFIRRGIGLYFDNTFPKQGRDPLTTEAYVNDAGFLQPSANMWKHREYLKRIWVLHQQLAPAETPPIMMLHMTNSHILPYMVFNQSNLDLEWFYGPEPAQSKYSHDMLRAQTIGLQTGNLPLVLADTGRSKEGLKAGERSKFGTMFVHEIKFRYRHGSKPPMARVLDFGYGRDDCRVYNYWADNYPLTADDPEAKSIILERNGELMIVIATWNGEQQSVTFALDGAELGVADGTLTNAETGDAIEIEDNTFTLDLPGYAVRILHLSAE